MVLSFWLEPAIISKDNPMRKKKRLFLSLLLIAAAVIFIFWHKYVQAPTEVANQIAAVTEPAVATAQNLTEFLAQLKASDLPVADNGEMNQPFLTGTAKKITLGAFGLQIFEYPDTAAAATAAKTISSDGSQIGEVKTTWPAPPHFYNSGNLIVLYIGNNPTALWTLSQALGSQIAGR